MDKQTVYYQPPESHDKHIRKMLVGLAAFFSVLFLVVALFIVFAKELAVHLPFAAEKRFVKPYEVMADKWLSDTLGEPEIEAYLQELANKLANKMALADDITLSIHYVDNDVENAFATLGGHIFVFKGVLNTVDSENALAMVLAHEIAHIQNRDPVVAMGRGAAIQMMYTFLTGDSLADIGGELGMLFFSREQEEDADMHALEALNKHYGHIHGYADFFETLIDSDAYHEDIPVWLSTHPDLSSRIDKLNMKIKEMGYKDGRATSLPDFVSTSLHEKSDRSQSLHELLSTEKK